MSNSQDPADLQAFQADLKLKLRYLGSFLSLFMIIFGLYLLVNGLFNMVSVPDGETVDQNSGEAAQEDPSGLPNCPSPTTTPSGRINGNGIMTGKDTVQAQSFSAAENPR
jgi:hypothetical protein